MSLSNAHDECELFVPGRICMFGEHSDWAGSFTRFNAEITPGMTIVCGTNQGLYAKVKRHPSSLILTTTTDKGEVVGPYELSMNAQVLLKTAQAGGFWSYAAGVAYKIVTDYRVSGLSIHNFRTDLPIKKGLSSSAAFCVLVARAFSRMYDLKMTIRGEMEYAYQGELATPSRCGRMDQGCAYGNRPVVMRYDGEFMGVESIFLRGSPLHYVVVDLAGKKSTTEILAGLQKGYPFPQDDVARGVHELLGPFNKRICTAALQHMQEGNAEALGKLMNEVQDAWDRIGIPACPAQLTAPLLHRVLSHPALTKHITGGKGVGSQGDGTAQLLCKSKEAQEEVMKIIERDFGMHSLSLTMAPSRGVRKAVIPAAGFSNKLYPASKAVKTELFPIMDKFGVLKPAILIHVEELFEAGIEEVVIVSAPDDKSLFERMFHQPDELENFNKFSASKAAYSKRIVAMGAKVKIVVQEHQQGFGHAVLCAETEIGKEPFLLMIGHHIYRSLEETSLATQMINAYKEHNQSIVAVAQSPLQDVASCGVVSGAWIKPDAAQKDGTGYYMHEDGMLRFLRAIGMEQYFSKFKESQLAVSQLPSVTAEELKEMDIPLGPRKRLLEAFKTITPQASMQEDSASDESIPRALRVTEIAEKPTEQYARSQLTMNDPGLRENTFLTVFGQYVLSPTIFDVLKEHVKNNVRHGGEFQLTAAIDVVRQQEGLVGLLVNGERFNIGTPKSYLNAITRLSAGALSAVAGDSSAVGLGKRRRGEDSELKI